MAAFVNLPRKITLLNLKLVCWLPCLHSLNWQLQQLRLCYDKGQIPKHHRRIYILTKHKGISLCTNSFIKKKKTIVYILSL